MFTCHHRFHLILDGTNSLFHIHGVVLAYTCSFAWRTSPFHQGPGACLRPPGKSDRLINSQRFSTLTSFLPYMLFKWIWLWLLSCLAYHHRLTLLSPKYSKPHPNVAHFFFSLFFPLAVQKKMFKFPSFSKIGTLANIWENNTACWCQCCPYIPCHIHAMYYCSKFSGYSRDISPYFYWNKNDDINILLKLASLKEI